MALMIKALTNYGEERDIYVRLNNFDQLANHGVPAVARFRGFLSKEAFDNGNAFIWELVIAYTSNAPKDAWADAYEQLKKYDPSQYTQTEVTVAEEHLKNVNDQATVINGEAQPVDIAGAQEWVDRAKADHAKATTLRDILAAAKNV